MQFLKIEWKMTVPNAISLARIALLPLFVWLYLTSDETNGREFLSFIVLVASGLSDLFDGMIARKFNQISDLGKLLDPLADKLTQVTVMVCLFMRYHIVIYLLIICLVKELCQGLGGLILLHRGAKLDGARWYGKVSTFVFYGVMACIVLMNDMNDTAKQVLIGIVAIVMLFAFFRYVREFFNIRKENPAKSDAGDEQI